ncbi:2-oxoglutarate and iron-dependent oxygenase JMJD4 homolog [Phlebotomus argentipes]|uniref:2-oxoglutarate and iron-dependent oxygenase JMJD4 homolog n=1 Tax=Phlebotomus argentipes TaxID=94469 RepID=UPI002892B36F|nr:2-oxoglutarate and iron-dependent oxygenase JMJD4 homolog [Phlebotomus argentipes]
MLEIANCKTILNCTADSTDYSNITSLAKFHHNDISYNEFFSDYMLKNIPVIIGSASDGWNCNKWTKSDSMKINFHQLREEIPNISVPVANCSKQYFNSHEKVDMEFHDFLNYWENEQKESLLYLKDWHLRKERPQYDFYTTPKFFASDWLNEVLCDEGKDDYKFVYMGPKGTWTSFHCDVFSSFSWSTNIVGQKQWIFLPPGEEEKLKDKLGNLPFTISTDKLEENGVKHFVVRQNPGEAIFVPTGWFHQVLNLEDTISVNHNWFNGTQIDSIWEALESNLKLVEKEIEDCRDMENFDEHCQVLLKASYGMNIQDFVGLLGKIAQKSLDKSRCFDEFTFGDNHLAFDLDRINHILTRMMKSNLLKEENTKETIKTIKEDIEMQSR